MVDLHLSLLHGLLELGLFFLLHPYLLAKGLLDLERSFSTVNKQNITDKVFEKLRRNRIH